MGFQPIICYIYHLISQLKYHSKKLSGRVLHFKWKGHQFKFQKLLSLFHDQSSQTRQEGQVLISNLQSRQQRGIDHHFWAIRSCLVVLRHFYWSRLKIVTRINKRDLNISSFPTQRPCKTKPYFAAYQDATAAAASASILQPKISAATPCKQLQSKDPSRMQTTSQTARQRFIL